MESRYSDASVLLYTGTEIERMGNKKGVSEETIKDAVRIVGDVLRSDYDYDSKDSVASACLYLACRRQGEPCSLPDIADVSRKPQKTIQHLSANLMNELGIRMNPIQPDPYIEDAAEEFGFSEEQKQECFELLERGKKDNLHSGLAATTVAGAIIYAVGKKHSLDLTQSEVAEFVNKTTVSIRNNFKDFLALADDVPVHALPPQTYDEALEQLGNHFDDLKDEYFEEAQHIIQMHDHKEGYSDAAVVGGAFLKVLKDDRRSFTAKQISEPLGVSEGAINQHRRRF